MITSSNTYLKNVNSAVSFAIKNMNIVKLKPLHRMYMKKNKIRLDRDIDVLYGFTALPVEKTSGFTILV